MQRKIRLFVAFLAVMFVANANAQSVDEIIDKHIKALGGKEKLQAAKSMKVTGKLLIAAMGMESKFTRQAKRPNLIRMDVDFQGQTMVQAYDGVDAWHISPMMGIVNAQPMPEIQAQPFKNIQSDFDGSLVDYKKKGNKIEFVGKEDVNGAEAYKLKVTVKNGDSYHAFIDTKNYLELKQIHKIPAPGGSEIEVEYFFGDYKSVQGLLFPHSMKINNPMQGNVEITMTSIEINPEIADSVFNMPKKSN